MPKIQIKLPMKFKTKLILSWVIPFVLIFSLTFLLLFVYSYKSSFKELENRFIRIKAARASHIKEYINSGLNDLKLISSRTQLRTVLDNYLKNPNSLDIETMRKILIDAQNSVLGLKTICITDSTSKIVVSTDKTYDGTIPKIKDFLLSNESDFKVLIATDRFDVPTLYFKGPLYLSKKLLGFLYIKMELSPMYSIISPSRGFGATEEMYLQNRQGIIVSPLRSVTDAAFKRELKNASFEKCFVDKLQKSDKVIKDKDILNNNVFTSYEYIEELDFCLVLQIKEKEFLTNFKSLMYVYVFFGLLAVMLGVFLTVVLAKLLLGPLEKLKSLVLNVKPGINDLPVIKTGDEVEDLSIAFSKLYSDLQSLNNEMDKKVVDQTRHLQVQQERLEDQQKALINVLDDIKQEKELSAQRANDLQKFFMAVENVSDHIVITDQGGIVIYANRAVQKITGYEISEVMGKKAGSKALWGGLMPVAFYEKMWNTIKIKKKPFEGEINNKRKNGEKYVAFAKISPVMNELGEVIYYVGIERDVTKEKEVDRMKTEFVSLASHQLNTPLSAMKWFLEMLLKGDVGKLTKKQLELVLNVNQSNERMISLVNSLLNVSRIESGRIIIDPKPTDVSALAKEVIDELSSKVEDKKIQLTFNTTNKVPIINVDPKLIRHVYANLLSNAIKYTPNKGKVSVSVFADQNNVVSQVSDTGVGVPEAEKTKLFEKFYRASNVVKIETDGSGLGLYLVKAIVESSGGKIWFESSEGRGTSFWFSLPRSGSNKKEGEVTIRTLIS